MQQRNHLFPFMWELTITNVLRLKHDHTYRISMSPGQTKCTTMFSKQQGNLPKSKLTIFRFHRVSYALFVLHVLSLHHQFYSTPSFS